MLFKILRVLGVLILIFCLVLVRKLEDVLFYDPLLQFFHGDFLNKKLPEIDLSKLLIYTSLRYSLNAILTIGILYLIYPKWSYIKTSILVLFLVWLILMPIYYYFIQDGFQTGQNLGFYVRRFLIQPMMLFILIPGFYYLKFSQKKK